MEARLVLETFVQVVLATCHSSGGRVLENTDFDLVIIDEATQALGIDSFAFSFRPNFEAHFLFRGCM